MQSRLSSFLFSFSFLSILSLLLPLLIIISILILILPFFHQHHHPRIHILTSYPPFPCIPFIASRPCSSLVPDATFLSLFATPLQFISSPTPYPCKGLLSDFLTDSTHIVLTRSSVTTFFASFFLIIPSDRMSISK
ncbi:MAG: hypothetical protein J3R72DRAFT_460250 [Linnemannia gamsii]|nr:MAG: hypothetical protein J3R72DRAFT_460250 [Linnemannia gamsii]